MNIVNKRFKDCTINVCTNDWSGADISRNKAWEPHITNFLKLNLEPNSVFVDVGSNYGFHTLSLSKYCKHIHSFDPQLVMVNLLKLSIEQNNMKNITVRNCALGDTQQSSNITPVDYNHPSIHMGEVGIVREEIGDDKIQIETLDSFNLGTIDFIKIDVQGYEKFVIDGAKETIEKYKPIIIIEVEHHQLQKFGYDAVNLFEQLRSLNYEIYHLDYHYPSDFACVHKDNLDKFLEKNSSYIVDLTVDSYLNHCLMYGVNKKIYYNDNISNVIYTLKR
jgi:FkbM family methyltransferase